MTLLIKVSIEKKINYFDNEDYNYYRFKELGITNITKSKNVLTAPMNFIL